MRLLVWVMLFYVYDFPDEVICVEVFFPFSS